MIESNPDTTPAFWKQPDGPRLPRIALMGEFSAGKSTLANMMIGTNPLPVQVVATQLPPVWMCYGDQPSVIVDLEGNETPCDLQTLEGINPEDAAFIRFYCEQEILRNCEIIDMPGISDPNMAQDVWARVMPFADGVLWCSPATQAWRQSEAAVWDEIEDRVREKSLLILTRADMLLTEKDKIKVRKRVEAEAGDLFADVLMISLVMARDAGDDEKLWEESGADEFVARFLGLLEEIGENLGTQKEPCADSKIVVAEKTPKVEVPEANLDSSSSILPRRPVLRREPLRVEKTQDSMPTGDAPPEPVQQPDPMSFMPKFS